MGVIKKEIKNYLISHNDEDNLEFIDWLLKLVEKKKTEIDDKMEIEKIKKKIKKIGLYYSLKHYDIPGVERIKFIYYDHSNSTNWVAYTSFEDEILLNNKTKKLLLDKNKKIEIFPNGQIQKIMEPFKVFVYYIRCDANEKKNFWIIDKDDGGITEVRNYALYTRDAYGNNEGGFDGYEEIAHKDEFDIFYSGEKDLARKMIRRRKKTEPKYY